ncbi:WhiB family transcriptional regulator [Kitasatospora sp. NPDC004745]|uniref:WhiB family transcriptional regulator n=1 Tax=unclassified Kitasatospora TaxID=2633591 RepID=UPI0033D2E91A
MDETSRFPAPVEHARTWSSRAACRADDGEVFLRPVNEPGPEAREREDAAKEVCGGCRVRVECRRHALSTREPYGVWGGLTERERSTLLARPLAGRGAA